VVPVVTAPLAAAVRRQGWPAVVALGAVTGLVLRVATLRSRHGVLDSDEAIVGLMAREMLHGHVWAFFWGQHYAGTTETAAAALVFAVAGPSVAALKATAIGLCAVSCTLLWRVGRRVLDERSAQIAGLLLWVGPAAYVWFGTKTRGFYWATLALGLWALLSALRIDQEGERRRDWIALGLAGGLGWWSSPAIAYFAVPAMLWLLVRRPARLRTLWPAVPAFLLGALPWLWHNVGHGFPSLDSPPQAENVGYVTGLGRLSWQVVPIVLGLRRPLSASWLVGGGGVYVVVLVVVAVTVARRSDRPGLVVLAVGAFPWIYAVFPGRWWVGEARYALFLAPTLFLLLAWVARKAVFQAGLLAVFVALSVVGIRGLGSEEPRHLGADIGALRRAGVHQAWAGYWTAHRLAFESDGGITSASALIVRHQPYVDAVARSTRPAWLYPTDDPRAPALVAALTSLGVPAREVRTEHFDAVVAGRRVDPGQVPPELRL
jgi:hypothetical protein